MNAQIDGYEDSPFQDCIRTMRKRATESVDEHIRDTERVRQYFDWDEDDEAARELREQED
jgi:hypothetical protein